MSFLHGRTQQVFYAGGLSVIICRWLSACHKVPFSARCCSCVVHNSAPRFISYVERIDEWMSSSRLKMNANNTSLLWLGTRQRLEKLTVFELHLLFARVSFSTSVSDRGVIDSHGVRPKHVRADYVTCCFFQLRQRQFISSLTKKPRRCLRVHAFVSSRLD